MPEKELKGYLRRQGGVAGIPGPQNSKSALVKARQTAAKTKNCIIA